MTRIVAGSAGGRRLTTSRGATTRPTTERVREALFSTLESLMAESLQDTRFLDLFAGSGAVGLEALSRGASRSVLVEHDREAVRLIRHNATALGLLDAAVVADRVEHHLRTATASAFDVAFLDPPYAVEVSEVDAVVALLLGRGWLAPSAVVVLERSRRDTAPTWPSGVRHVHERRYGDTVLWYGRHSADPAPDPAGG